MSVRLLAPNAVGSSRRARCGVLLRRLLVPSLLVLPGLLYLPHLTKGFVSEDFLLIRLHREVPPWHDLVATFTSPWLGMRLFEFYRPVAALAFGVEAALFGAWSPGYHTVHLAVHLGLVGLLFLLLRRLVAGAGSVSIGHGEDRGWILAAAVGTLFFGLYPLAPNAVLFAASFATLFGAISTVGAALLYVRWRSHRDPRRFAAMPLGAVALYLLALGCYESAAALPVWLGLYELISSRGGRRRAGVLLGLLPFALTTCGYLTLRLVLFGDPLGGYANVAERLRAPDLALVRLGARSLLRLPAPFFDGPPLPSITETTALAALLAASTLWLASAPAGERWRLLRLQLLGVGWMVVFLAPFSFQAVVPANGRYWYLAAAGVAMILAAIVQRAALGTRPRTKLAVVGLATALLLTRNAVELVRHLRWMDEAALTCLRIAHEIARVRIDGEPMFVADHPLFLTSDRNLNLAQVFHYGLRSAVSPPFHAPGIEVYPLPPRGTADPRRLALERPVYRWQPKQLQLTRLRPRTSALPPLLDPSLPRDGATISPDSAASLQIGVETGPGARFRVVTSAPGNYHVETFAPGTQPALPGEFVRFWEQLWGGEQHWWVELVDAQGRTMASSAVRRFRVEPARPAPIERPPGAERPPA